LVDVSLARKPTFAGMTRAYFISAIGLCLGCAVATASAQSAGPPADYKIRPDYTDTSPDKKTTIEQYAKILSDGSYTWQFWARRQDALTLLKPEQPDYRAGFRFTNDSRWLVRMQKTGSGEASLYLYRLGPQGFVAATTKPLDELAWAYFYSRPVSRKIKKPDFHIDAELVAGTDDNYRSLGENWPDSRYLVISLSGDVLPNRRHGQIRVIRDWRCRYDLQTGTFDIPSDFTENNAKAIALNSE
jgi:hypothetical protein